MRALSRLLDLILPLRAHARLVRDADDGMLIALSSQHRISPYIRALFAYREPLVRAAILEAKFKANPRAERLLAEALRAYLTLLIKERSSPLVLVPVPLSQERLRERGYNQVERIARRALARPIPGISLDHRLVIRTRATLPQTTLSGAERRRNVACAFQATRPPDPAHTYIVLDDVTTTGATLEAAMAALRAAGAQNVSGLALAHQGRNAKVSPVGDVAEWSKVPHC